MGRQGFGGDWCFCHCTGSDSLVVGLSGSSKVVAAGTFSWDQLTASVTHWPVAGDWIHRQVTLTGITIRQSLNPDSAFHLRNLNGALTSQPNSPGRPACVSVCQIILPHLYSPSQLSITGWKILGISQMWGALLFARP